MKVIANAFKESKNNDRFITILACLDARPLVF